MKRNIYQLLLSLMFILPAAFLHGQQCSTITAGGAVTFCQGGSVTLTSTVATTYLWSTGATTRSVTVTASGTYQASVTVTGVCSGASNRIIVTVHPNPTVNAGAGGSYCAGSGASVLLGGNPTATGSLAPYTYLWTPNTNLTSNAAPNPTASPLSTTTYTVSVTDANTCHATSSATVTVNPIPLDTVRASGPETFCQGGSVTFTASAGLTAYHWSSGQTTQAITAVASGSYNVTVTNTNACTAASAAIVVTVTRVATANITVTGPTNFCQGGSTTLTATHGSSYHWSTGQTTQAISVTSSGSYTVTVDSTGLCNGVSVPTIITVNPLPVDTITTSGPTTFCQGGSVTITSSIDSFYHWSNGQTSRSITVTASGSYTVTVTTAAGCSASSITTVVVAQPAVSVGIFENGSNNFCQGGSVILDATHGSSYHWSDGETTQAITVTASGSYSITVDSAGFCPGTGGPVVVTVSPKPIVNAGPDDTICAGSSVVLGGNPTVSGVNGAFTIAWYPGSSLNNQFIDNPTASPTFTTDYVVTATDSFGCFGSDTVIVTVKPVVSAGIYEIGSNNFCQGGSVTLDATPGSSYHWSDGETTKAITVTTSGSYSVTVDSAGFCPGVAGPVVVTVYPTPIVNAGPDDTICAGSSVVLGGNPTVSGVNGAFTIAWYPGSGLNNQFIDNPTASPTSTTGYVVTATDSFGCFGSDTVIVTVQPVVPVGIFESNPNICQGGRVILDATHGSSYHWSDGETTQAITVTSSGSYSVTVDSAGFCPGTRGPVVVTVHPTPIVNAGPDDTICVGTSVVLGGNPTVSGVNGAFTIAWYPGSGLNNQFIDNPTASPTFTSQYVATATDSFGCSASDTVTVTVNPAPIVNAGLAGDTICAGTSVVLGADPTVSGVNGVFTIIWYPGSSLNNQFIGNPIATPTLTTQYFVTATDSLGCSGSDSIIITVNPVPIVTITIIGPDSCGPVTIGTGVFNSYVWSTGATSQFITVTTSGTYTVVITDSNGCSSTDSLHVIVNNCCTPPVVNAGNNVTVCAVDSPAVFVLGGNPTASGGAGAYTFAWSPSATLNNATLPNPTASPQVTTNYTVTVTDINGCSASSSVTINIINLFAGGQIAEAPSDNFPGNLCAQQSVFLAAPPASSYLWNTGQTTQSIVVTQSGLYTVILDSAGCQAVDSITIYVGGCCSTFHPTFTIYDTVYCASDTVCGTFQHDSLHRLTTLDLYIDSILPWDKIIIGGNTGELNKCGPLGPLIRDPGYHVLMAVMTDTAEGVTCADTVTQIIYIKPSCSCACMCTDTCPYMQANFTCSSYQGYMVLRDSSIGNPTYDEWFINGQTFITGPGDSLVYTVPHSGNFTVCLTIHHLVYGSDLCCLSDTCKTVCGMVDTCSLLNLTADFTYNQDPDSTLNFTFTPTYTNGAPSVVIWNFGDSTSIYGDSTNSVTHTFDTSGLYNVCVNEIWYLPGNYCCIDSQCYQISAGSGPLYISVRPNPFSNTVNFSYKVSHAGKVELLLFNELGEEQSVLINSEYHAGGLYQKEFDLSTLPAGVYTYRYKSADGILSGKIIRQ